MIWTPDPFPHAVGNLFDAELLDAVLDEFPSAEHPGWRRYGNDREVKLEGPPALWGEATQRYFDQLAGMADALTELTGIADLQMETIGGGYHLIPPGGYLDVHTDFNRSPQSNLYRRLNVLTYLNKDWHDDGGRLELWDDDGLVVEITPEFATTAIFETSDRSWHGHPKPASRWRKSVAAYFFSPEPPPGYRADHSTVWHA
jgi:Rps23 Pro-64 3,4-dihydroxylase Tpa1-like proline 4-hydroxylase